jgi:hypothetical protein
LGQLALGGGFLRAFPTFFSHLPGRTKVSGFGPRFRGGFPFDLAPIGPSVRRFRYGFELNAS